MILKLGSQGPGVLAWQRALLARGHAVVVDGDFGPRTHNATCAFQATCDWLEVNGCVDLLDQQAMLMSARERLPPVLAFNIPFIQAKFFGGTRAAVDLIVLHCMEGSELSTRAERSAQYIASLPDDTPSDRKKSCGYFVDCDSVVQGVADHRISYHCPGANHNGIGIEHAGFARQSRQEWLDAFGLRMLGLSAQLSARLCQRWDIPARYVPAADLGIRKRGITTHYECTKAFGRSSHTDPGPGFPIDWYVKRVAKLVAGLAQGVA